MPLPLIAAAAIPVAAKVGIGVGVAVLGLAGIGVAAFKFKTASKNDKADLTVLLIGESSAGKDTVLRLLKDEPFSPDHSVTTNYYETIISNIRGKIIKVVNTSGSESTILNTALAKEMPHNIRCYVFDARKYYSDRRIKLGIQDSISDCQEKGIKVITIGTRGAEINDINKIENEIKTKGSHCKIFEFKNNPREEVLKYIFEE